jgi:hypothetical protein
MQRRTVRLAAVTLVLLLVSLFWYTRTRHDSPADDATAMLPLGNAHTLLTAYNRWKAGVSQYGGDRQLTLTLRYSKGLSAAFTTAHGQATLDLVDGNVTVEVSGLPEAEAFDVWLVDNRPGRPGPGQSVRPEPGDVMIPLGSLQHRAGIAALHTTLHQEVLTDFQLDLIVVTRAGAAPADAGLLFGTPSLFQRLYYSEQRGQFARMEEIEAPATAVATLSNHLTAPFRALVPSPAQGQWPHVRFVPPGGEQLYARSPVHCHSATSGSALCGRIQPRPARP